MQKYQEDEFFHGVFDVVSVLEHVNVNDLAYQLVKECPERAGMLALAIDFELMDKDFVKND
jgi:hypothetical protein